jgi:Asp-tRNA(Asn)/Glu-tRNA(Gln) amidotransferase A subunit family amidase
MLVFIDESGDPGVGTGSRYLVIAMVIFHSTNDAKAVDNAIDQLRHNGHHKREFKFSGVNPDIRDAFFDVVMPRKFDVKAVILDMYGSPTYLDVQERNTYPEVAYRMELNKLLSLGHLSDAKIRLDGRQDKRIERNLKFQRDHFNKVKANSILKIGMRDSKKDNLIQLADMVAGAIARSFYPEKRAQHNRWRDKLKLRKGDLHFSK